MQLHYYALVTWQFKTLFFQFGIKAFIGRCGTKYKLNILKIFCFCFKHLMVSLGLFKDKMLF